MYSVQIVPPLYLLQTLVVFAEQENLVQTAERLGLTQPTVSRQLQQLEELFTQPLFSQQGRNKVLTSYAQALVKELKPRFTDIERIFQKVDQTFSNPKEITLRIGGPKELLAKHLSQVSFAGTIEVDALAEQQILERFQEQALDLSISTSPVELSDIQSKKLSSSIPALAIPQKWATSVDAPRDWAQICEKHPAALFSRERPLHADFEAKYKIQPTVNYVFNDWTSLERRVRQQKSWAVIPSSYLHENEDYKIIPLNGLFETHSYYLAYRKDLLKYDWMKALISEFS